MAKVEGWKIQSPEQRFVLGRRYVLIVDGGLFSALEVVVRK
jgi:hypothetical protein